MAPSKANAMQTTSTFNFTARSAGIGLLACRTAECIRGQFQPEAVNVLRCTKVPSTLENNQRNLAKAMRFHALIYSHCNDESSAQASPSQAEPDRFSPILLPQSCP